MIGIIAARLHRQFSHALGGAVDLPVDHWLDAEELEDGANMSGDALVPVPGAVWLFGSALGLMGAMRRKVS